MFCSECGAKIPDEGGFCPECGTPTFGKEENNQPESEPVAVLTPAAEPKSTPEITPVPDPEPTFGFAPTPLRETALPPDATNHYPSPDATPQYPPPGTANQYPPPGATPQYPPPGDIPSNFAQPAAPQQNATNPAKPKKSKKGLFIALGAALLVVLLVVGGFVAFNIYRSSNYDNAVALLTAGDYQQAHDAFEKLGDYQDAPTLKDLAQRWLDYEAAQALLDAEDYEGAKRAFEDLGDFEDSMEFVLFCQYNIDYLAAISNYESGDFENALKMFTALTSAGFSDALDWQNKTSYALAGKLYDAGDFYGAYKAFKELDSYEDSATRMEQCTTAYPSTGELQHHDSYVSSASAIAIDGVNAGYAAYFKIYNGGSLVSTIFLNPGGNCTIEVPPGDYTIKEATGSAWFGEEIMFGDEGSYEIMLFDGSNDYFNLPDNIITTITLSAGNLDAGESVGADPTSRSDF
jgi:tetratricopeptide (TPR) repeat protein